MSHPTPEQWRKIFLDAEPGRPELQGAHTEERFLPTRAGKGLTSAEHFARYLFASTYAHGRRVLDVACGVGYGAYILKLLGARQVVGVDRDAAAIELARRAYPCEGLEFRDGDAAALDLAGPPFDLIVSFETVEHVEDPDAFLRGLGRLLAPDGLLIISCPHDARSPWVSPFHLRHYTYQEFHDLAARHFPDPQPVVQVHGIASLILPLEAARADDLAPQPLPQTYLEVSKPVEDSDVFLLLCGRVPNEVQPTAVISKNLSDMLQDVYAGVSYIRERVPILERDLAEANAKIGVQLRQTRALTEALEDYKTYTLELLDQLEQLRYSRTWQLMLACREALRSPAKLLALPLRIARILTEPPGPKAGASAASGAVASALLPQYLPHRRSAIVDWPPDRPLVTVGIPCYNYGRYLQEAIDSVLASTFRDFEIIVVNDGSTDAETLRVLAGLETAPPAGIRFQVVHQPNQGLAASRNKGAALGRGKYVISLDADDRIAPTYLEKTLWVLEHHPQYAFCYSLVQMFGAEESVWKTEPFSLERALRYNHVPTGAVFRREAWVEAGGFRDELYGQDDWNFWITLGARGWEGCLIDEPLFHYRKHAASMWSGIQMPDREVTARKIQAMHTYLTGAGDSREAETFNPPKDPVARAALDSPGPPPAGRSALARRPHLPFGDGRPAVLFAIPWMAIGGAERIVLEVMKALAADYGLAAATTVKARHIWEEEFRRVTPWIYHLAKLPLDDPAGYLCDLVKAHGISGVVISGSALAYQALPALKQAGALWTADIVHNTVPEGYLEASIRFDPYLDCHFAVGVPQWDALSRQGRRAEKIRLAPNGIEAYGRFNPATYAARLPEIRGRLRLHGDEVVLVYTGRLAVEKDVPLFVRVVGEIVRGHPRRKFRAFILGDGPERPRVEHEIRAQGLQGIVELTGFTDQVAEVLAVSRFAFLTSRFEGSSVTLLEAMSMRLVALATGAGNAREVIEDGSNGFVIPAREPADFAARVGEVLADPARQAAIRDRARQTVVDRYNLDAMVRIYAETLGEALARRGKPQLA